VIAFVAIFASCQGRARLSMCLERWALWGIALVDINGSPDDAGKFKSF
jgi:hypothetical protein